MRLYHYTQYFHSIDYVNYTNYCHYCHYCHCFQACQGLGIAICVKQEPKDGYCPISGCLISFFLHGICHAFRLATTQNVRQDEVNLGVQQSQLVELLQHLRPLPSGPSLSPTILKTHFISQAGYFIVTPMFYALRSLFEKIWCDHSRLGIELIGKSFPFGSWSEKRIIRWIPQTEFGFKNSALICCVLYSVQNNRQSWTKFSNWWFAQTETECWGTATQNVWYCPAGASYMRYVNGFQYLWRRFAWRSNILSFWTIN